MRDAGLEEAIRAAGGVGALAQKIGISQPSVSNWARVPAERVVAVEAATGVDAHRPAARSLRRATGSYHRRGRCGARRRIRAALGSAGARTRRRIARAAGAAARRCEPARARPCGARRGRRRHHGRSASSASISISSSGSVAASCCPTARIISPAFCMSGRSRGCARIWRGSASSAAEDNCEPEDHAAILCEIMAGSAGGKFPAPAGADRALFEKHLAPWIGRFFADLERAADGGFLPASRNARPGVHRHRDGSLRAAVVTAAHTSETKEDAAMKQRDKARRSELGRRDFLRALGAGAGAAAAAAPLGGDAQGRHRDQR